MDVLQQQPTKIKDGQAMPHEDLQAHSALFDGSLSIDTFSSDELKMLCNYYGLWRVPFFDDRTRRRLYRWLEEIRVDDARIRREKDTDAECALSYEELVEACE